MTSKWSIIFFLAMVAAISHSSTAQTTHVVGAALGWTFPPNGAVDYTTWATQQTFTQGDILVFNFPTGRHNVAEVTRTSFDTCNTTQSPISVVNNGPANITLNSTGQHFYICTFPGGHCAAGMKLAINVSASVNTTAPPPSSPSPSRTPPPRSTPSSPAPVPSPSRTPPPQSTPSSPAPVPSPSSTPSPQSTPLSPAPVPSPSRTYVVGDTLGWTFPPSNDLTAYATWASNKTFFVGDTLVFNFLNGGHNVAELTSKADFDSCTTTTTSNLISTSPARVNLATTGEHFYVCTFPTHCISGMKFAINVSSSTTNFPPSSGGIPPPAGGLSPTPPSPSSASKFVIASSMPITLLSLAFALVY